MSSAIRKTFHDYSKDERHCIRTVCYGTTFVASSIVKHANELAEIFFGCNPLRQEHPCAYLLKLLIQTFYTQIRRENCNLRMLLLINIIKNQCICRDSIEFCRCFISGSICSGGMRQNVSITKANNLCDSLNKLFSCSPRLSQEFTCDAYIRQQRYVEKIVLKPCWQHLVYFHPC